MSYTIYAKHGKQVYKIGEKFGSKFILRPISGMPYLFIFATVEQLKDRKLFELYPIFKVQS